MKLTIELKTLSLFNTGGVTPTFMYYDIPFHRTRDPGSRIYKPTISGSSLKGALRSALIRIADAFGLSVCSERPNSRDNCDICYLFGAPGGGGSVYVSDLVCDSKTLLLTHVSLDDRSLTARRHALYSVEYVPPGTIFRGEIDYEGEARRLGPLLLALAALRTDRVGRSGILDLRVVNAGEVRRSVLKDLGRYEPLLEGLGVWAWDEILQM